MQMALPYQEKKGNKWEKTKYLFLTGAPSHLPHPSTGQPSNITKQRYWLGWDTAYPSPQPSPASNLRAFYGLSRGRGSKKQELMRATGDIFKLETQGTFSYWFDKDSRLA